MPIDLTKLWPKRPSPKGAAGRTAVPKQQSRESAKNAGVSDESKPGLLDRLIPHSLLPHSRSPTPPDQKPALVLQRPSPRTLSPKETPPLPPPPRDEGVAAIVDTINELVANIPDMQAITKVADRFDKHKFSQFKNDWVDNPGEALQLLSKHILGFALPPATRDKIVSNLMGQPASRKLVLDQLLADPVCRDVLKVVACEPKWVRRGLRYTTALRLEEAFKRKGYFEEVTDGQYHATKGLTNVQLLSDMFLLWAGPTAPGTLAEVLREWTQPTKDTTVRLGSSVTDGIAKNAAGFMETYGMGTPAQREGLPGIMRDSLRRALEEQWDEPHFHRMFEQLFDTKTADAIMAHLKAEQPRWQALGAKINSQPAKAKHQSRHA